MTRKKASPKSKPVSMLMLGEKKIAASEFKARCLEIMDEVERTGVEVTITKHRRPVVRLVPATAANGGVVGSMKGSVLWYGDIISPIDVEWSADESNLT